MDTTPGDIRDEAYERAQELLQRLPMPPGTALVATGSFARRDMTPYSDLDLILLHPDDVELDAETVQQLWAPVWESSYHLDYSVRTPQECVHISAEDSTAGFAQLDFAYVAGDKQLVDATRAQIFAAWRRHLTSRFDSFVDTAIARWHRSGAVVAMTNPDIKNGRGGLRDIAFLRALALANLCDVPNLSAQRELLLDVRTLLHVTARRHRDVLDPEFAADIAVELGYRDRYELVSALVAAAVDVERALQRGLATARGLIGKRGKSPRRPLDIDVVEAGGMVTLARNANTKDPWLLLRVAAASARTGRSIDPTMWSVLERTPAPPELWRHAAVEDFFALLAASSYSTNVIRELDDRGLWERFVPDWPHIRGLMPRERTHTHSVDFHSLNTVARCAEVRTTVARPDLLLLSALFHDLGKGYGRPHEQVGAELVARQAVRMRLSLADRSRVQTIVAEHTTLARISATMDPYSDAARDRLLDAAQYDHLTISLLKTLAAADAQSTGPGVWNKRLEHSVNAVTSRALEVLQPNPETRPLVNAPSDLGLRVDEERQLITVFWRGDNREQIFRLFALIGALGWTIIGTNFIEESAGIGVGEFDVRPQHQTLADAADEARFIQSFKSGVYSELPAIEPAPTTATFDPGGILVVRSVERVGALARLIHALPDFLWLRHQVMGATMIVHVQLRPGVARAHVVRTVTAALANGD